MDVSATPSASGRLQLQKHQAATSACLSARGRGWKSRFVLVGRPHPGTEPGHSLACSMDFKQRPVVSRHLEAEESEFHCQERRAGWGLVHRGPPGRPFSMSSVEPGAWEPTLLRCLSLCREGNRGTLPFLAEGGGEGWSAPTEMEQQRKEARARAVWPLRMHASWLRSHPPV